MNPAKLLTLPLRYRPWRPRHVRLILEDVLRRGRSRPLPDRAHLDAAIQWLCRAQDVRASSPDRGGVSAGWSFEDGWLPSYPETTGYIIETFLASAETLGRPELVDRAHRMLDWELSLQTGDGTFPGHFGEPGSHPVIFNTGQILHGLLAGYEQLRREECMEAAVRAADWLVRNQDEDGCWRRFEHNGIPHVYNTRATWALVRCGLLSNERRLLDAARRHLDWALARQCESGWYRENAFTSDRAPFTHTIAYAIRGFLECGLLLEEERYIHSARKASKAVAMVQRADGYLAGTYAEDWTTKAAYACLTGIAQMSCNWQRIVHSGVDDALLGNARKANDFLKRHQWTHHADDTVRGALLGSAPIWGDYSRFEIPNWATKFFADALLMMMTGTPVPRSTAQAASSWKQGTSHV